MTRVGVDLDGVLYNFQSAFIAHLKSSPEVQRYNVRQVFDKWDFFKEWGMSSEEFIAQCNIGVDRGIIFRGPARKRAGSALRRIKAAGHEIHIVTDRSFGSTPKASQDATYDWLTQHRIPFDSVTFCADKTTVPTDMFVEDKLENYDMLDSAGTEVYLINRPWNKRQDNRRRITSVTEFANIVTKGK